jgi:hypothetical protein
VKRSSSRKTPTQAMYVVCITGRSGWLDYKAFRTLEEAKVRFEAAEARIPHDFDGVALFEVPAESAKKAVSAVEAGEAKLLERDERSAILEDAGRVLDELFTGREANKAK